MQIQINTDKTIDRHQGLDEHVQEVVGTSIQRFGEQITRVEVYLSNENSAKSADGGNRCTLEARVTGYQPVTVSDHSITLHQAVAGAAEKLKRALDSALGRLHDKRLHDAPRIGEELLIMQASDESLSMQAEDELPDAGSGEKGNR